MPTSLRVGKPTHISQLLAAPGGRVALDTDVSVTSPTLNVVEQAVEDGRAGGHAAISMRISSPVETAVVARSTKPAKKKGHVNDGVHYLLSQALTKNARLIGARFVDVFDVRQLSAPEDPALEARFRALDAHPEVIFRLVFFVKAQKDRSLYSGPRFTAYLDALIEGAPDEPQRKMRAAFSYKLDNLIDRFDAGVLVRDNVDLNLAPLEAPAEVPVDETIGF